MPLSRSFRQMKPLPSAGWVAPWDGQKTATEVMDDIVAQYGNFMNNGAMLYKGVQDYTAAPAARINTNSMLPIPTTTSLPSAMPAV